MQICAHKTTKIRELYMRIYIIYPMHGQEEKWDIQGK